MKFTRGDRVEGWTAAGLPQATRLPGRSVYLRPLEAGDADALFTQFDRPDRDFDWYYMPFGPFREVGELRGWIKGMEENSAPLFFVMCRLADDQPFGFCSYLNIRPTAGSIEIGFIQVGADFQRSTFFTEAMFLMADNAFSLGYRRYEWKCDSLNERSRRAAHRLGFSYEGKFRQAMVVKERNRDTKWFSIINKDWPGLRAAFKTWLAVDNFDAEGRQRRSLSELTRPFIATQDPDLPAT